MREFEGTNYLTIGEVAKTVERSTQTIKYWYKWLDEQSPEVKEINPLPQAKCDLDARGTHFFKEEDVPKLLKFRDEINYGKMSAFNHRRWGNRGKDIMKRRTDKK